MVIKKLDCEAQLSFSGLSEALCQTLEHRKCYPLSLRFLVFILINAFSFLMIQKQLTAHAVSCFEAFLKWQLSSTT